MTYQTYPVKEVTQNTFDEFAQFLACVKEAYECSRRNSLTRGKMKKFEEEGLTALGAMLLGKSEV
ncbi:MAG: hypothetical protein QXF25_01310 [Candidatus Pacearchaeota archaeon]